MHFRLKVFAIEIVYPTTAFRCCLDRLFLLMRLTTQKIKLVNELRSINDWVDFDQFATSLTTVVEILHPLFSKFSFHLDLNHSPSIVIIVVDHCAYECSRSPSGALSSCAHAPFTNDHLVKLRNQHKTDCNLMTLAFIDFLNSSFSGNSLPTCAFEWKQNLLILVNLVSWSGPVSSVSFYSFSSVSVWLSVSVDLSVILRVCFLTIVCVFSIDASVLVSRRLALSTSHL